MKLKFWGVRGSIPAPTMPQSIRDKLLKALKTAGEDKIDLMDTDVILEFINALPLDVQSTIGGNTTCISLEVDGHFIIFDAGSGLRELGQYLMSREFGKGQGHAHIFFTHAHWDHVQGFPFFVPAFIAGNRFDIYHVHPYLPDVLKEQMDSRMFPAAFSALGADIRFHRLQEGESITLGPAEIDNILLNHPGKSYAYRTKFGTDTIILATDGEYKNLNEASLERYVDFYRDADILIFDAQFSVRETLIKEDWGHSSALVGADIARAAKVKRLLLFHHDPTSTDAEIVSVLQQTREYLHHHHRRSLVMVDIAREGLEFDFNTRGWFQIETSDLNGLVCLSLSGDFDLRAIEAFKAHISQLAKTKQDKNVILDFENLGEITMAGMSALLDAKSDLYNLAVVNVPPSIHRIMELSGMLDFFAIYENVDDVPRVK